VRIELIDHRSPPIAAALSDLLRSSYRVEADLIGFEGIPGLSASAASVAASILTWVGALKNDELVGAIAYEIIGETVDIDSLVVAPANFRSGIGRCLLHYVLATPGARRFIVGTGAANLPAVRLYESEGFQTVERIDHPVAYIRFERLGTTT